MTVRPLRVLVWGPGGLGRICIREMVGRAEFDLAGVLAYSPESDGVVRAALPTDASSAPQEHSGDHA
jgi:hypothetical protein